MLKPDHPLEVALRGLVWVVVAVSVMSGVVNILALSGSVYMLQVYDRVLTSRSVPTLLALSVLTIGLFLFQGLLDIIRAQIMVRVAGRIDYRLTPAAQLAVEQLSLSGRPAAQAMQPIHDVDQIRNFLAGPGPVALLDLPWMPVYLLFTFLLHPWLGFIATGGALLLMLFTLLTDTLSRSPSQAATKALSKRLGIADANRRNADALRAMGFGGRAASRYLAEHVSYVNAHAKANDVTSTIGGLSKVVRMALQSANLGVGAYLTLQGELTAGGIIAASIASSRALAPIEAAIGQWKGLVAARQSRARLRHLLGSFPEQRQRIELEPPYRSLAVENIAVAVPGSTKVVIGSANFELAAGQGLGIIGPSASGKSTLARALTGIWPLGRGTVRLDGASIDNWSSERLGRHVGYLPQDVSLFAGTIGENIARFETPPESAAVLAAARAANVHEMILQLPDGYDTRLEENGAPLSVGQRQRIALARALYRDPFFIVLDEPNSNLDSEGEAALVQALVEARKRGAIVIIIAHRPSVMAAVDMALMMKGGQVVAFGPRDEVLRKVLAPQPVPAAASLASA